MTWRPFVTSVSALVSPGAASERRIQRHLAWVRAHSPWYAEYLAHSSGDWRTRPPVSVSEWRGAFDTLNTAGLRHAHAAAAATAAEGTDPEAIARTALPGGLVAGWSSGTSGAPGLFVVSRAERAAWALRAVREVLPGSWRHGRHRVAMWLRAPSALYRAVRSPVVALEYFGLATPLEHVLPQLDALRPTCLVAPASTLRALVAAGAHARGWPVRRVVAVAEGCPELDAREIAQAFGTPVAQMYQATEGFLGATCAAGHLHLHDDVLDVQYDWVDATARRARPVVTDIARCTQPVVRLRLDDLWHVGDGTCACGRSGAWLHAVEGRVGDLWTLAGDDGVLRTVWPSALHAAMARIPEVQQYRLIQTGPAAVTLQVRVRAGARRTDATADCDLVTLRDDGAGLRRDIEHALGRVATAAGASVPTWTLAPYAHDRRTKLRRVMRDWAAGAGAA